MEPTSNGAPRMTISDWKIVIIAKRPLKGTWLVRDPLPLCGCPPSQGGHCNRVRMAHRQGTVLKSRASASGGTGLVSPLRRGTAAERSDRQGVAHKPCSFRHQQQDDKSNQH